MDTKKPLSLALVLVLVFVSYCFESVLSTTVTYDHRALVIDGKRRVLQSGSIHYPRSTPEVGFVCPFIYTFVAYILFSEFSFIPDN